MDLVHASRNCFTAFNAALEAVERNDASGAAIILQSVQLDSKILRREARSLYKLLLKVEVENETRVENLILEINNLYEKEQELKQEERTLGVEISKLKANKNHHQQSRNDAQRRYEHAKAEQRSAEIKREEFDSLWWVPLLGWFLAVREFIEDNDKRARAAAREAESHDRDVENAGREIHLTNDKINQVHQEIKDIQEKMNNRNEERNKIHKALGECKSMTEVAMEVLSFSEELINLTDEASLKTNYLERILALAAKKKINIKDSGGMKRAVNSFEDSWINIADKLSSNRIAILNDSRLISIYEARYSNTHLFHILIACVAVMMVLLFSYVLPKY